MRRPVVDNDALGLILLFCMIKTASRNFVRVRREEYARLKTLQKHFADFWSYFEYLRDIREARKQVKGGETISQEKLFKELGI